MAPHSPFNTALVAEKDRIKVEPVKIGAKIPHCEHFLFLNTCVMHPYSGYSGQSRLHKIGVPLTLAFLGKMKTDGYMPRDQLF